MNIAFFSESYLPYLSGVTISIDALAKELKNLGHNVSIFAPHNPRHIDVDPNIFRFPSIRTPYPGFRLAIPISRRHLKRIPELNLNIIHTHSPYGMGLLSMFYSRRLKIPLVYTFHTLFAQYLHYFPILPKKLMKHLLSRYIRGFCDRCDIVIVPSSKIKNILEEEKIKTLIEVVPSGVPLKTVHKYDGRGIREKFGIPSDAKVLLYVGRLSLEKNLPFLFESFKLVNKEMENAYLILVAGGPMEKKLKGLAEKLKLQDFIIFTGQVNYPEVFNYYKASDMFVFSSLTETQGLVLAEAKACGLPIVAISAEGVTEMVKDGVDGFLVKAETEEFAMRTIQLLLDPILRKEMSNRALENAAFFSSEVQAKKVEAIYRSLTQT